MKFREKKKVNYIFDRFPILYEICKATTELATWSKSVNLESNYGFLGARKDAIV